MSLIVEQGEEQILILVKNYASWSAQLYTSSTSPQSTDVLSNYSLASYGGSAPIALSSWGTIANNSERAQMAHSAITWTADGSGSLPVTVYGYVVFDGSSNLIWATAFDTPQTISTAGDFVTINIQFMLFDYTLT